MLAGISGSRFTHLQSKDHANEAPSMVLNTHRQTPLVGDIVQLLFIIILSFNLIIQILLSSNHCVSWQLPPTYLWDIPSTKQSFFGFLGWFSHSSWMKTSSPLFLYSKCPGLTPGFNYSAEKSHLQIDAASQTSRQYICPCSFPDRPNLLTSCLGKWKDRWDLAIIWGRILDRIANHTRLNVLENQIPSSPHDPIRLSSYTLNEHSPSNLGSRLSWEQQASWGQNLLHPTLAHLFLFYF